MKKIAVNRCFGGFGLSEIAYRRYAELKGLTLYPETEHSLTTYWTCPPDQRPLVLEGDDFYRATIEERQASNAVYTDNVLYDKDIPRDDPDLIKVIEELGDKANGRCGQVEIAEIPDGVDWQIEEYDGLEHVAEKHRTW